MYTKIFNHIYVAIQRKSVNVAYRWCVYYLMAKYIWYLKCDLLCIDSYFVFWVLKVKIDWLQFSKKEYVEYLLNTQRIQIHLYKKCVCSLATICICAPECVL